MKISNDVKTITRNPIAGVLDIETGSLRNKTHIFTIGLVIGNLVTGEILAESYYRINGVGQEDRIKDHDTFEVFWKDSSLVSLEAQREIFDETLPRMSLAEALLKLNDDINDFKKKHDVKQVNITGNGSEFDNAIIVEAYRDLDIELPWKYGDNQSLRTIVWLGRLLLGIDPKYAIEFEGILHHALHDCRHEFKTASTIVRELLAAIKEKGDV